MPSQGSGAGQASSAAPDQLRMRSIRSIRSCLRCHQRKVRCDKTSPCSSCTRMGVFCSYPGPDPPPRRPHKTTIADVSARLARLEKRVDAMAHGSQHTDDESQSTTTARSPEHSVAEEPTLTESSSNGVLVNGGHSSRYFNEILLSRVLEEVSSSPLSITSSTDETRRGRSSIY